jgi:hypothetical protein
MVNTTNEFFVVIAKNMITMNNKPTNASIASLSSIAVLQARTIGIGMKYD